MENYCRWGISLAGAASMLGYKTASGVLKALRKLSAQISPDALFRVFQPAPTKIMHLDEVESRLRKKPVFRWFARGSGENSVAYAWALTTTRNFVFAKEVIEAAARHNRAEPKIWVSDGLTEYHTALLSRCEAGRLRTVFLGRELKDNFAWLTESAKERVYAISRCGGELVVHKGLREPMEFCRVPDARHYTTTIETILSLFQEHGASCVYVLAYEKTLPFCEFSKRFLAHTEGDRYTYHFIGHCTNGNTAAEILSRRLAHRMSWHNEVSHSVPSSRKVFNLQMAVYNVLTKLEHLDNRSPFEAAGAHMGGCEEAWRAMLCI